MLDNKDYINISTLRIYDDAYINIIDVINKHYLEEIKKAYIIQNYKYIDTLIENMEIDIKKVLDRRNNTINTINNNNKG